MHVCVCLNDGDDLACWSLLPSGPRSRPRLWSCHVSARSRMVRRSACLPSNKCFTPWHCISSAFFPSSHHDQFEPHAQVCLPAKYSRHRQASQPKWKSQQHQRPRRCMIRRCSLLQSRRRLHLRRHPSRHRLQWLQRCALATTNSPR